jgi:hypothetical protein
MNIQKLIGCTPQTGDVGVEIEMEANNMPSADSVSNYWRLERDPSLRGESGEFVLRKPIPVSELDEAFLEIKSALKRHKTEVKETYRAGIHVHVNVQDLTPKQLITFISTYFMMEEVLLSYCDKSRSGNHFCLRMTDASYTLDLISEAVAKADLSLLNTEDLRYASLNVTSLFKYGSIEFRALESTVDFSKIKQWATVLHQLKVFAKTINNPTDILGEASALGFSEFAKVILGGCYREFKPFVTEEKLRKGIRNIQYALHSRSWSEVDLNIFNKNKSLFSS